jgi:TPR repeat protein
VEKKVKEGDGASLCKIGTIYYEKRKYKKALHWLLLAAEDNDTQSQYQISQMYFDGLRTSVDYKLAME